MEQPMSNKPTNHLTVTIASILIVGPMSCCLAGMIPGWFTRKQSTVAPKVAKVSKSSKKLKANPIVKASPKAKTPNIQQQRSNDELVRFTDQLSAIRKTISTKINPSLKNLAAQRANTVVELRKLRHQIKGEQPFREDFRTKMYLEELREISQYIAALEKKQKEYNKTLFELEFMQRKLQRQRQLASVLSDKEKAAIDRLLQKSEALIEHAQEGFKKPSLDKEINARGIHKVNTEDIFRSLFGSPKQKLTKTKEKPAAPPAVVVKPIPKQKAVQRKPVELPKLSRAAKTQVENIDKKLDQIEAELARESIRSWVLERILKSVQQQIGVFNKDYTTEWQAGHPEIQAMTARLTKLKGRLKKSQERLHKKQRTESLAMIPFSISSRALDQVDSSHIEIVRRELAGILVRDLLSVVMNKIHEFRIVDSDEIANVLARFSGTAADFSEGKAQKLCDEIGEKYCLIGEITSVKFQVTKRFQDFVGHKYTLNGSLKVKIRGFQFGMDSALFSKTHEIDGVERWITPKRSSSPTVPQKIIRSHQQSLLRRLRSKLLQEVTQSVTSALHPLKIIKVLGKKVYVNHGGARGLEAGQVFEVICVGEKLVDEDSGEVLGQTLQRVGKIQITKVNEKYCEAALIDGRAEKSLICRKLRD
jgi:hypothetical protein